MGQSYQGDRSDWTLLTIYGLLLEAIGPLLLRQSLVRVDVAEAAKDPGAALRLHNALHQPLQLPELVLIQDVVRVLVQHGELPIQHLLLRGSPAVRFRGSQILVLEHLQEVRVELILVRTVAAPVLHVAGRSLGGATRIRFCWIRGSGFIDC